jgi:hypothetical protein
MKKLLPGLLLGLIALTCHLPLFSARAQGAAFIYQGQLNLTNGIANGSYDLTFTLFNTDTGGLPVAGTITTHKRGRPIPWSVSSRPFRLMRLNLADPALAPGHRQSANGAPHISLGWKPRIGAAIKL